MALNDDLRNSLERVKIRIIDDQAAKGIRLTGFSANSLEVTRARDVKTGRFNAGASLVSAGYLVTNFEGVGSQPNVPPSSKPGSPVYKWVQQRGLKITVGGRIQTTAQAAFLIARSLSDQGSRIKRGTAQGIAIDRIVAEEMPETLADVGGTITAGIIEDLNKAILL